MKLERQAEDISQDLGFYCNCSRKPLNDFQQGNSRIRFALKFFFSGHYMTNRLELGKSGIQKPYLEAFSMIKKTAAQRGAVEMGEKWMDLEYILEMESAELGDRFDMLFEGARGHQGSLPGSLTS